MKIKFIALRIVSLLTLISNLGISSASLSKEIIYAKEETQIKLDTKYFRKELEEDYILGVGDEISILISPDYPEKEDIVSIDSSGTIQIQKLNRIYVQGLTQNELNNLLNKAYSEFVLFPEVKTKITKYRPVNVFVKGAVETPGIKSLEGDLSVQDLRKKLSTGNQYNNIGTNLAIKYFPTVFDAIRAGGGINRYADISNVQVIRRNSISNGGGKKYTNLNFLGTLEDGDLSQNIRIYDGDIIVIKKKKNPSDENLRTAINSGLNPRFLNVYIQGRVQQGGMKTVARLSTLNDSIYFAGGLKPTRGPITFIRYKEDGTFEKRKFSFTKNAKRGSYKNPYLKNYDLIFVGNSLLNSSTEVINEITSPFAGIFSAYGLYKAFSNN